MSEEKKLIPAISFVPEEVQAPQEKLYLVLLYVLSQDSEDEQIFKFIRGRQEVYDYLKTALEAGEEIDVMKSRVLVDSPKIQISHKCSVFVFMRDMKSRNLVFDDSNFDINEYYYQEEADGEEEQQETTT